MREPMDSLDQLCQSLYGREAQPRDYSPYVRPGIVKEAAVIIDQLNGVLTAERNFIHILGITGSALVDGMRDLTSWVENEAQPALLSASETLDRAAGEIEMRDREIDRLEDQVDTNDRLISMAADRIESDGRYIEGQAEEINRLHYYESVLCWSPPSKMVMTAAGACGMPEIENIVKVIDERDRLRKELAEVKMERDEAQATLDSISDFMGQR